MIFLGVQHFIKAVDRHKVLFMTELKIINKIIQK